MNEGVKARHPGLSQIGAEGNVTVFDGLLGSNRFESVVASCRQEHLLGMRSTFNGNSMDLALIYLDFIWKRPNIHLLRFEVLQWVGSWGIQIVRRWVFHRMHTKRK